MIFFCFDSCEKNIRSVPFLLRQLFVIFIPISISLPLHMSNTSSLVNLVATFNSVLWSFHYVILPICYILGNIGNCLNLVIFSQRSSRENSCLIYFLFASIINIFILNFGLILRILRGIWNIDPALQFLWFCKWRTYFVSNIFLIYRCTILLACVDRMCASSRSAWMRMLSRPKVAYRLIAISWVLCMIYFIPSFVFQSITYGQCIAPPGSVYATYLTISTLCQSFLIPLVMITCGLITVRHLKLMRTHVVPMNTPAADERRIVGQFVMMLLAQVATDCLTNAVYPIYLIYSVMYPAPQTAQVTATSVFLVNLSFNVYYLDYSAGFYLYTLSSPAFRRKFLHLLRRIAWLQRFLPRNQEMHHSRTLPMTTLRAQNTIALN